MHSVIDLEDRQRVSARAELAARRLDTRTRLSRLFQEGAAKIRMPAVSADPLEAVLINTAGGLTGGDRIAWRIEAGAQTDISVTTQACEKVYRADAGHAEVEVELHVGEGARIAWLPQETIVFDRSAFRRSLKVELAEGAEALIVESAIFGRLAMGERTSKATFRDRWRIAMNGRLVHAEDFCVGPDVGATLVRRAATGGAIAVATLLLVAEDASRQLDAARDIVGGTGGVSAWAVAGTGKLLARIVAEDGYSLRGKLVPLIGLLNGQAGLPKVWSF